MKTVSVKEFLKPFEGGQPTAEEVLRLEDTAGGVKHDATCLICSAAYTAKDDDLGVCPECATTRTDATKANHGRTFKEGETICVHCAKVFATSPFVGVRDQLCPECRKTSRGTAILRCAKCQIVIERIAPCVMDCGFEIKPNMVLHSDSCNICNPALNESDGTLSTTIIEVDEWMKNVRKAKTFVRKT